VAAVAIVLGAPSSSVRAATQSCAAGTTLNIVAHEDDDLLFMSPSVLHDVQSNRCVVTVFTTAGDAGRDATYWQQGREQGAEAAYANMAGVGGSWAESTLTVSSHTLQVRTLANVTLVFMRLPDGHHGEGYPSTGYESLQELWGAGIPTIHAIDGSTAYTKQQLVDALTALMNQYRPDTIRTQDYLGYAPGDHSDHYATARFANQAQLQYPTRHTFVGYIGYATSDSPLLYSQNVTGSDLMAKENAFYAYAAHDSDACASAAACAQPPYNDYYPVWLAREYGIPVANAGPDQTVDANTAVTLDGSASTGRNADALSYAWTQTDGPAVSLSGANTTAPSFTAPANGATLSFQLTVNDGPVNESSSVTINVTPVSDLQITNGDGKTSVDEGLDTSYTIVVSNAGPSDASGAVFKDAAIDNLNVTGVTCSANAGAECPLLLAISAMQGAGIAIPTLPKGSSATFIVTGKPGSGATVVNTATIAPVGTEDRDLTNNSATDTDTVNRRPTANAGSPQTVSSRAHVMLDGSATDPDSGDTLTYAWTQTEGTPVALSDNHAAAPTFTAPAAAGSLTFKLTVSDGSLTGSDSVTISVSGGVKPAVKTHKRPQTTLLAMKLHSAKRAAMFRFSGSGGSGKLSFQCRLDTQQFSSCRIHKSYKRLALGRHVFRVRARDATGLADLTLVTKRFKI
jgi:uncharacterized repeat protein (TIGR01451 family)